jgi:hypothetical protein
MRRSFGPALPAGFSFSQPFAKLCGQSGREAVPMPSGRTPAEPVRGGKMAEHKMTALLGLCAIVMTIGLFIAHL